jgi:hypothetical protein
MSINVSQATQRESSNVNTHKNIVSNINLSHKVQKIKIIRPNSVFDKMNKLVISN